MLQKGLKYYAKFILKQKINQDPEVKWNTKQCLHAHTGSPFVITMGH